MYLPNSPVIVVTKKARYYKIFVSFISINDFIVNKHNEILYS